MNRSMRRASEAEGRRVQKLPWNQFADITHSHPTRSAGEMRESGLDRVWQNHRYIVFLHRNDRMWMGQSWDRVMARRSDAEPMISWSDMQRIKNEIFGEEIEAIQFLPKQTKLVDQANLYWFFVRSEESR